MCVCVTHCAWSHNNTGFHTEQWKLNTVTHCIFHSNPTTRSKHPGLFSLLYSEKLAYCTFSISCEITRVADTLSSTITSHREDTPILACLSLPLWRPTLGSRAPPSTDTHLYPSPSPHFRTAWFRKGAGCTASWLNISFKAHHPHVWSVAVPVFSVK